MGAAAEGRGRPTSASMFYHPYIYPESMHGMIKYDQKPS
jgi:hypothetical protein